MRNSASDESGSRNSEEEELTSDARVKRFRKETPERVKALADQAEGKNLTSRQGPMWQTGSATRPTPKRKTQAAALNLQGSQQQHPPRNLDGGVYF